MFYSPLVDLRAAEMKTKTKVIVIAAMVLGAGIIAVGLIFGVFVAQPLVTASNATTHLLGALERDDWAAASQAVQAGANVNLAVGGRPLLIIAVRSADLEEVRFLLNNGVDVDARTAYGRSALHEAALYGLPDIASLLIERGADVNARNPRGETPLFYAEEGLLAGPPRTPSHFRVASIIQEHGGVR